MSHPIAQPLRPGKETMLPSSPPLRTARESSPSSSSSLSNALERTRLHLGFPLAVELLVARWVQQHPIFKLVSATFRPPNLVVVVPSRQFGNPLVTSGTQSLLLLPESKQLSFSPEGAFHFHAKALFKIHLPFGVKGIGCPLDFHVPLNEGFLRREC